VLLYVFGIRVFRKTYLSYFSSKYLLTWTSFERQLLLTSVCCYHKLWRKQISKVRTISDLRRLWVSRNLGVNPTSSLAKAAVKKRPNFGPDPNAVPLLGYEQLKCCAFHSDFSTFSHLFMLPTVTNWLRNMSCLTCFLHVSRVSITGICSFRLPVVFHTSELNRKYFQPLDDAVNDMWHHQLITRNWFRNHIPQKCLMDF
jgi:hypothetical protein